MKSILLSIVLIIVLLACNNINESEALPLEYPIEIKQSFNAFSFNKSKERFDIDQDGTEDLEIIQGCFHDDAISDMEISLKTINPSWDMAFVDHNHYICFDTLENLQTTGLPEYLLQYKTCDDTAYYDRLDTILFPALSEDFSQFQLYNYTNQELVIYQEIEIRIPQPVQYAEVGINRYGVTFGNTGKLVYLILKNESEDKYAFEVDVLSISEITVTRVHKL